MDRLERVARAIAEARGEAENATQEPPAEPQLDPRTGAMVAAVREGGWEEHLPEAKVFLAAFDAAASGPADEG